MTKTKDTIEVLKETKSNPNKHISQWGDAELTINPKLEEALSYAITALTAQDQAEGMLPEKKEMKGCPFHFPKYNVECPSCKDMEGSRFGFNEMHSIAQTILAKKILECEEKDKRIEDLLLLQEKFGDYHREKMEELQSLKSKLTVENVEKIIEKNIEKKKVNVVAEDLGFPPATYGDKKVVSILFTKDVYDIAQALIEYLKGAK